MVHGLEAEYNTTIDFIYLDRDNRDNTDFLATFGIRGQPVFVFLDADGNEVQRWYGRVAESQFRTFFDEYLAANPS